MLFAAVRQVSEDSVADNYSDSNIASQQDRSIKDKYVLEQVSSTRVLHAHS